MTLEKDPRVYCAEAFAALCEIHNKKPSPFLTDMYLKKMKEIGYARVAPVLERLVMTARYFPTIAELIDEVEPSVSIEAQIQDVGDKILKAIERIGGYKVDEAEAFLGPLAWQVVQTCGGWQSICNTSRYDQISFQQDHWRKLAKMHLERQRCGIEPTPPTLKLVPTALDKTQVD